MNIKTQKITFGAMIVAIFALILLINRQTGDMFESVFFFVFPIPMVAYSARYGLKSSIAVFICTIMCTMLLGTLTTAFYAVSQAFIGIVYGTCLYHKKDPARTLILVMFLSAVFSAASIWVTTIITGIPMSQTMTEIKTYMDTYLQKMQEQLAESGQYDSITLAQMNANMERIFSIDFLTRLMIISMAIYGMFEGMVIYKLSAVILRRLRYPIEKAKPLSYFYPPEWTGIVSLALTYFMQFTLTTPLPNEILHNLVQTVGICCSFYLLFFGIMAAYMFLRRKARMSKIVALIIPLFLMLTAFQSFIQILGCAYISLGFHRWLDKPVETQ